MIHVVLADDHTIIRDGLKAMLQLSEKSIQITGEASNGKEAIELLETLAISAPAQVILMDINMPEMNGLAATRYIHKHFPDAKVIILSMMEEERFVTEAFQAGAAGYLLKSAGYPELTHAIEVVAAGGQYITAQITLKLLDKHSLQNASRVIPPLEASVSNEPEVQAMAAHAMVHLTKREVEVLRLIAQGFTNAEIADQLFTSKRTVENHRQSLLEKTGSKNTALLIRYAIANHLLEEQ